MLSALERIPEILTRVLAKDRLKHKRLVPRGGFSEIRSQPSGSDFAVQKMVNNLAVDTATHRVREVDMKWITRKNIKVDRVACPWLIKRFVDPHAEFLFVEERNLLEKAKLYDAIPFDAPKIEAIKLNHRGPRCSFEAILEDYSVADPALQRLALIVRAADVKGQESAAPEGIGLRSIAQGFAALGISDEERLVRQFPIYDALYAYVQGK